MSLLRDFPFTVHALKDTIFVTCSAITSTAASTSPTGMLSVESTAGALAAGGGETTGFGRVVDRLRFPQGGAKYDVALVGAWLQSTRGSTEANRRLSIGARLQHGDSSGGGDMADYSTQFTPDDRNFFSTVRTSDYANWDASRSTGPFYGQSNPAYYDVRAAKRYIRMVGTYGKNKVTTESSGDEGARIGGVITFLGGDFVKDLPNYGGALTTSTST
jgi:hypothetical protein